MSTECMTIIKNNNSNGEIMENRSNNSEFRKGIRVLAVDDNQVCLTVLTALLHKCQYQVKSLMNKTEALALLKQEVDNFDIVLTNVNIDDMDGFKLLEAGIELGIPVIMISVCESEPIIKKGLRHGAVDYLIKPVRLESVKSIWQHVYRKKPTSRIPVDKPRRDEIIQGGFIKIDDEPPVKEVRDELGREDNSSKRCGKRKCSPEDDDDMSKRDRIKWTHSLGGKFLDAVQTPFRSFASHLQKYRKFFKDKTKTEDGSASTSTVTTTTTNNNISSDDHRHLFAPSSNASPVVTTLSNMPIPDNMSRLLFPSPSYQYQTNNNPWLTGPSVSCPPHLQQRRVDQVNQPMYPQQSVMHINGNFMSTISNTLAEPLYPQLPLDKRQRR